MGNEEGNGKGNEGRKGRYHLTSGKIKCFWKEMNSISKGKEKIFQFVRVSYGKLIKR